MARLTTADLDACTDAVFGVARRNMLTFGRVTEVLLLLDAKGRRRLVTSLSRVPFIETPEAVREYVRDFRARAVVHAGPFHVTWLKEPAAVGGTHQRLAHRPERLIIASAFWPARKYSLLRMAQVIEVAGTRDVAELDVPGVQADSWLADLLPRH